MRPASSRPQHKRRVVRQRVLSVTCSLVWCVGKLEVLAPFGSAAVPFPRAPAGAFTRWGARRSPRGAGHAVRRPAVARAASVLISRVRAVRLRSAVVRGRARPSRSRALPNTQLVLRVALVAKVF